LLKYHIQTVWVIRNSCFVVFIGVISQTH
jgi:hypothetical protein